MTLTCRCYVEDRESSLTEPVMHIDSKYRVLGPTHETLLKNVAQGDCPNLRPHGPQQVHGFQGNKISIPYDSYDTKYLMHVMLLKARLTRAAGLRTKSLCAEIVRTHMSSDALDSFGLQLCQIFDAISQSQTKGPPAGPHACIRMHTCPLIVACRLRLGGTRLSATNELSGRHCLARKRGETSCVLSYILQ